MGPLLHAGVLFMHKGSAYAIPSMPGSYASFWKTAGITHTINKTRIRGGYGSRRFWILREGGRKNTAGGVPAVIFRL